MTRGTCGTAGSSYGNCFEHALTQTLLSNDPAKVASLGRGKLDASAAKRCVVDSAGRQAGTHSLSAMPICCVSSALQILLTDEHLLQCAGCRTDNTLDRQLGGRERRQYNKTHIVD